MMMLLFVDICEEYDWCERMMCGVLQFTHYVSWRLVEAGLAAPGRQWGSSSELMCNSDNNNSPVTINSVQTQQSQTINFSDQTQGRDPPQDLRVEWDFEVFELSWQSWWEDGLCDAEVKHEWDSAAEAWSLHPQSQSSQLWTQEITNLN